MSLLDDPEALRRVLPTCLDVPRWVGEVVGGLPFASPQALLERAGSAADPLLPDEVQRAVDGHPRIGRRPSGAGGAARAASRDQAAITGDDDGWAARMAAANARYEEHFGRVFLIRAAGRSQAEILAELERRMLLAPDQELAEVGRQLREIAVVRLRRALDDESAGPDAFDPLTTENR